MMRDAARLAMALLVAMLAGCAMTPPHPDAFRFAVMGDTPYTPADEGPYHLMLQQIDAAPVSFVIHVGDFTNGSGACTDALYARRKAEFDALAHPLIYTPGDNEWTDCHRGGFDSLERLAALRKVFFASRRSLGRNPIELAAQDRCADAACRCPAVPENRFWTRGGVRFVTLSVPGSNNDTGRDAAGDAEAACRDEANFAWLDQAVRAAERSETVALVIALQADPWAPKKPVYEPLLARVRDAASRLRKPVLFVHGDSHVYTVDMTFKDARGHTLTRLTRLETYGSPFVGWVEVGVDPDDPEVFSFKPHLVAVSLQKR